MLYTASVAVRGSFVCFLLSSTLVAYAGSTATVSGTACGTFSDPSAISIDCAVAPGSGAVYAAATSYSAPGVIKIAGSASVSEVESGGRAQSLSALAQSDASFSDALSFSGFAQGTTALLTYGIVVRGTTSANLVNYINAQGNATLSQTSEDFELYTSVGSQLNHYSFYRNTALQAGETTQSESTLNNVAADLFGVRYFTVPITFGNAVSLTMRGTGLAAASVSYIFLGGFAQASANYQLGNSMYWGGVQSLTVNGRDVAYNVTSASGADYSKSFEPAVAVAIPEPSSVALMLLGLIATAFAVRWKAQG